MAWGTEYSPQTGENGVPRGILGEKETKVLMSKLGDCSVRQNVPKYKQGYSSVLPRYIIDTCENFRLSSGFRLLKRCLRHAMDPWSPSLLGASSVIIRYKGKTGFMTTLKVRASMKGIFYQLFTTLGKNKLHTCIGTTLGHWGFEKRSLRKIYWWE